MGVLVTEKQFKGHGSEYCLYPLRRNEKSLTLFHGWWWWFSCEVVSDSCDPLGVELARLLCSWDSLGKNTGVDCHFLLHVLWLNYCYFVLLDLTVCFLHFLTSLIKFILWSFSTDKRQTEVVGGSLFLEGLEGSCSVAQVGKCSSWPKGRLWQLKDKWTLSSNPLTKLWCLCPFPLIWAGLMFTVI